MLHAVSTTHTHTHTLSFHACFWHIFCNTYAKLLSNSNTMVSLLLSHKVRGCRGCTGPGHAAMHSALIPHVVLEARGGALELQGTPLMRTSPVSEHDMSTHVGTPETGARHRDPTVAWQSRKPAPPTCTQGLRHSAWELAVRRVLLWRPGKCICHCRSRAFRAAPGHCRQDRGTCVFWI